MDWQTVIMQIIGYIAPMLAAAIVQGVKKLCGKSNWFAIGLVVVIGGISALIGIGPVPGTEWADKAVNAGFITGLASLLFSIFKKRAA